MKNILIVWFGKLLYFLSKKLNLGAGSTWPGHVALSLNPNFIKDVTSQQARRLKIILIAGTNGKTTTAKLLQHILEGKELKVFRNEAGANLLNGIASTLIRYSNTVGHIPYDAALFEVDENTFPLVLKNIKPDGLVLLNLFRDQLDRYGEVNTVAKKWFESTRSMAGSDPVSTLITNGDDPQLTFIGKRSGLQTYYFGLNEKLMTQKETPHDVDFLYCPNCKTKLEFRKMSYSHMGRFLCKKCKFLSAKTAVFDNIPNPMLGLYNKYNVNAAALAAQKLFGIDVQTIREAVKEFQPAFGRQEKFEYKGKNIFVLLSKNPTGFNQSIEAVLSKKKPFTTLLVLNDRIPDGTDVSWIWDVDFEDLSTARKIFISGDRAYDMGLRIKYSEIPDTKCQILEDLSVAIEKSVEETKTDETLFILPTYSAMLEVRKILTGRKIL